MVNSSRTKGDHLAGNEDTNYKAEVIKELEDHYDEVGEVALVEEHNPMEEPKPVTNNLKIKLFFQQNWEQSIGELSNL